LANPLLVEDEMADFPLGPLSTKAAAASQEERKKVPQKTILKRKIGSYRDAVRLPDIEVDSSESPPTAVLAAPEEALADSQLLLGEFRPRPPRQFAPKAVKLECVPHHSKMSYKDWREKVAAAPGVSPGNLLSMRRQGPHTLVVVYDGVAEEPILAALRGLNRLTSTWRPRKDELTWTKSWLLAENHRATTQLLQRVVETLEKAP
jgi:hypothetical protein